MIRYRRLVTFHQNEILRIRDSPILSENREWHIPRPQGREDLFFGDFLDDRDFFGSLLFLPIFLAELPFFVRPWAPTWAFFVIFVRPYIATIL